MSLNSALSVAGSGLAAVNAQLALISHNVANASTPGYAVETAAVQSVSAGGQGMGVVTAPTQRAVDQALQANLLIQNATTAGSQTTANALAAIDAAQGTPGQGQDLASLLGKLQDSFSSLLSNPSSTSAQQSVVAAAGSLANGINTLSTTITQQRQSAQDSIVSEIGQANTALAAIGQLSDQIIGAQSRGESTADLEISGPSRSRRYRTWSR